jgi:hypothetical protein
MCAVNKVNMFMAVTIDTKQSVFIHLPKNAGSSITNWLCNYVNGHNVKRKHDSLDQFKRRYPNYNIKHSFAVVRNPWDRAVSAYFYNKKFYALKYKDIDGLIERKKDSKVIGHLKKIKKSVDIMSNSTFEEFILKGTYLPIESTQTSMCLGVSCILRYEQLEKDFDSIQNFFNVDVPLGFDNKSSHKLYQEYYTSKTKDIIYNYYKEDISKWNYEF